MCTLVLVFISRGCLVLAARQVSGSGLSSTTWGTLPLVIKQQFPTESISVPGRTTIEMLPYHCVASRSLSDQEHEFVLMPLWALV